MNRCNSPTLGLLLAAIAAPGLVACAGPSAVSATTVTAAAPPDPSSEPSTEPEATPAPAPPATAESTTEPTTNADAPAAPPPYCRATDVFGVTTELSLEWNGGSAEGVLRSIGPSGEVTVTKVRAERRGGSVIADDATAPYEDLVEHKVTVREGGGKRYMRVGDAKAPWSLCEAR